MFLEKLRLAEMTPVPNKTRIIEIKAKTPLLYAHVVLILEFRVGERGVGQVNDRIYDQRAFRGGEAALLAPRRTR